MRIYTRAYSPFRMGGSVHHHIATDVQAGDPIDLGKGAVVRVVVSPNGKTYVVERETGAIIGFDLDAVRADISRANPYSIEAQLKQARIDSAAADTLTAEEFWSRMARAKG